MPKSSTAERLNAIKQAQQAEDETQTKIDAENTVFKPHCKNDEVMTDEEFLDEYYDFNILRAEMYFPRARLYDLPARIAKEERLRELMMTERTPEEQTEIDDNIFLQFFDEMSNFPRGIKDNFKQSVEETYADEQALSDKLEMDKQWETDFELENFIRLLNREKHQPLYEQMKADIDAGKSISINKAKWKLIEEGEPKKVLEEIINKREDEGFLIAHLFWYMLRCQVHHKDKKIPRTESRYASGSVFEKYIFHFMKETQFPGTNEKQKFDNNYVPDIKRKLWPSAHLWAALHHVDGRNTGHLKDDKQRFISFLKRADALYKLAVEHGVYQKVKPQGFHGDMVLSYSGFEGDPASIDVPDFDEEEMKFLNSYVSRRR